jgi:hypothetical protein
MAGWAKRRKAWMLTEVDCCDRVDSEALVRRLPKSKIKGRFGGNFLPGLLLATAFHWPQQGAVR